MNGQCIDSTPQDCKLMRFRAHVLHSLLKGFVQRRSQSVLQKCLPIKTEFVLLIRMTPFQRKLYNIFMDEVVRSKKVPNPLKAFSVCCKIWNHTVILQIFVFPNSNSTLIFTTVFLFLSIKDVLYNFLKKRELDLDIEGEENERPDQTELSAFSKKRMVARSNEISGKTLKESQTTKQETQNMNSDDLERIEDLKLLKTNYMENFEVKDAEKNPFLQCNNFDTSSGSSNYYSGFRTFNTSPNYINATEIRSVHKPNQNLNSTPYWQAADYLHPDYQPNFGTQSSYQPSESAQNYLNCPLFDVKPLWKNERLEFQNNSVVKNTKNDEGLLADVIQEETKGLLDGDRRKEQASMPVKKNRDDGIPYDWAIDLMKEYVADLLENSPKMEIFFCILEESIKLGDRLLVFSQSLLTLNILERFLKSKKIPDGDCNWSKNVTYFRLDGSTTALERERLINDFNSNPKVKLFLVSTRAGSLGINLVGANRVIVFDASWNPCHVIS